MPILPVVDAHEEASLVLIAPRSRRILVSSSGDGYRLPSAPLSSGRLAYSLTQAVESHYGLQTIQLALHRRDRAFILAVHEVLSTPVQDLGLFAVDLEQLGAEVLQDEERNLVRRIIEGGDASQGRFARVGWIDELLDRIEPHLAKRGQRVTGLIRHFNAGIDFSLLWIHTDSGPNVWFKAVGEPNTREFAITVELARAFPACLPRIVCTMPDWNAWLAEDAEGYSLGAAGNTQDVAGTLRALALVQQDAIGRVARLRQLGAVDWPLSRLLSLEGEFFAELPVIMAAQVSTRSLTLTPSELAFVQAGLQNALAELMAIGIPDSLVHGDIGHGNVRITEGGPVFLDWSETYIGHPFLTAEHLLVDLERSTLKLGQEQRDRLREMYLAEWNVFAGEGDLATAARLMPAVAALAYAVMIWHMGHHTYPDQQRTWPLLRSLVRRMKVELERAAGVPA